MSPSPSAGSTRRTIRACRPSCWRRAPVVFTPPDGLLNLVDVSQWWRYVPGADWRHPQGPGSSIEGRDNHPVVNVAYEDALAYAEWAGRALPSEAQWEFAARGGLDGATYSWGDEYYDPVAGWRANSWQGLFPLKDDAEDGYHGTAPVGCFAPNGYGLFDMAGNVWEYARDWYLPGHPSAPATDPQGPDMALAVKEKASESKPWWAPRVVPPKGAPNVLLIMTDDPGFGAPGTFGGVIPTPAMDRIAKAGCATRSSTPPRSARRRGRR